MTAPALEQEGTWEKVVARAPEPAGQCVRLIILAAENVSAFREASSRSLLHHAGT